jgi:hypothetical protein
MRVAIVGDIKSLLHTAIDCAQPDGFVQVLAACELGQEDFKSQILALDRENPGLYWITRNIDFTEWIDKQSQVLWISGPSRKLEEFRQISLDVADATRKAFGISHSVLFFSAVALSQPVKGISFVSGVDPRMGLNRPGQFASELFCRWPGTKSSHHSFLTQYCRRYK